MQKKPFLLALVGNAVLIPAVLFYLLMDWDRLVMQVRDLIPPRLRGTTDQSLGAFAVAAGVALLVNALVMLAEAGVVTGDEARRIAQWLAAGALP